MTFDHTQKQPHDLYKINTFNIIPNASTDFLNFCCIPDFEYSNSIFYWTPWLMMIYYQSTFGCKTITSSEDIVKTVIFWTYKPSLWPSPWKQQPHFFGGWDYTQQWCTTIPSWVTKGWVVEKISPRQTTESFNDLDLKLSNPVYSLDAWWSTIKLCLVARESLVQFRI